ncbi:MAG: hypothetical protein CL489_01665 [Acidobacteria bacterium]|nr:hypothetical protein [Acidobacteriota bacterium]
MSFIFSEQDTENSGGFEQAKAGTYIAKVTGATFVTRVDAGKHPYIQLFLNDAETGESLCAAFISLSPNARGISAKKLKILGVPKRKDGDYEATEDNLINLRVNIRLVEDPKKGRMKVDESFGFFGFEEEEEDVPF